MRDYQLRATIRIEAAVLILALVPVANDRKQLRRVSSVRPMQHRPNFEKEKRIIGPS